MKIPQFILDRIKTKNTSLGDNQALPPEEDYAFEYKIVKEFFALTLQEMKQTFPNVDLTNVDLASFSSHKLFAPKGAGVLMKKSNIKLTPLFYGGGQEFNLRSGTSNWPTNISMARALRLLMNSKDKVYDHVTKLWNRLYDGLKDIDVIHINSPKRL